MASPSTVRTVNSEQSSNGILLAFRSTASKLKLFEEKYAKYLFTKLISRPLAEEETRSDLLEENDESSQDEQSSVDADEPVTYSRYVNRLFIKKRAYITQHEVLVKELSDIANADKLYADNPDYYPTQYTEYGYPDEYRCNYIRKDSGKHKLYRCSKKIALPNSEYYCTKHIMEKNCFIDEYNKLASALT